MAQFYLAIAAAVTLHMCLVAAVSRSRRAIGLAGELLAAVMGFSALAGLLTALLMVGSFAGNIFVAAAFFPILVVYVASLNFFNVTGHALDLAGVRTILINVRLGVLHEVSYSPVRASLSIAAMIAVPVACATVIDQLSFVDRPSSIAVGAGASYALAAALLFYSLWRLDPGEVHRGGPFACLLADGLAALRFRSALAHNRTVAAVPAPMRAVSATGTPTLVVLVVVDSLRSSLAGAPVPGHANMPRLSQWREQFALFENHRCNAMQSDYSDISLLAGDVRWRGFFHGMPGPTAGSRTLHQLYKAAGWRTAHLSAQDERWCRMDRWLHTGIDTLIHAGDPGILFELCPEASDIALLGGAKLRDAVIIDSGLRLIERSPAPLFATINLQSTHVPFTYPASAALPWPDIDPGLRIRFGGLDARILPLARQKYANALSHIDDLLGRLIESLQPRLATGDAVLWITGDTGQAFGEHGYSGHGAGLHEEVARTPLIAFDPRYTGQVTVPTDHLQVYASLAALSGTAMPDPIDAQAGDRPTILLCQTPMANQIGLVIGATKYVMDLRTLSVVAFDLRAGADELNGVRLEGAVLDRTRRRILSAICAATARAAQRGPRPGSTRRASSGAAAALSPP